MMPDASFGPFVSFLFSFVFFIFILFLLLTIHLGTVDLSEGSIDVLGGSGDKNGPKRCIRHIFGPL